MRITNKGRFVLLPFVPTRETLFGGEPLESHPHCHTSIDEGIGVDQHFKCRINDQTILNIFYPSGCSLVMTTSKYGICVLYMACSPTTACLLITIAIKTIGNTWYLC